MCGDYSSTAIPLAIQTHIIAPDHFSGDILEYSTHSRGTWVNTTLFDVFNLAEPIASDRMLAIVDETWISQGLDKVRRVTSHLQRRALGNRRRLSPLNQQSSIHGTRSRNSPYYRRLFGRFLSMISFEVVCTWHDTSKTVRCHQQATNRHMPICLSRA